MANAIMYVDSFTGKRYIAGSIEGLSQQIEKGRKDSREQTDTLTEGIYKYIESLPRV
jgi:hypothetical protein